VARIAGHHVQLIESVTSAQPMANLSFSASAFVDVPLGRLDPDFRLGAKERLRPDFQLIVVREERTLPRFGSTTGPPGGRPCRNGAERTCARSSTAIGWACKRGLTRPPRVVGG
jgi:hypothetical protein